MWGYLKPIKLKGLFIFIISLQSCTCLRNDVGKEKLELAQKYLKELDKKTDKWVNPSDLLVDSNIDQINDLVYDQSDQELFEDKVNSFSSNSRESSEIKNSEIKEDIIVPKVAKEFSRVPQVSANKNNISSNISTKAETIPSKKYIFITRWLKMFLSKFTTVSLNGENKVVSFLMSDQDIKLVRSLLSEKTQSVREFDDMLSKILSNLEVNEERTWMSQTIPAYSPEQYFICFVILCVLFFYMWFYPKSIAFILSVLIAIAWQWMHLYQEAISKKHARLERMSFPEVCHKHNLGLLENIRLWMHGFVQNQGTCEEYYKALMVDPFWEITPSLAISAAASKFILYPLEVFAETANNSIVKLFNNLSIFYIIMLLLILAFVFMMVFNYRIRLPFFLTFEPSFQPITNQHTTQVPHHEITSKEPRVMNISINNTLPLKDEQLLNSNNHKLTFDPNSDKKLDYLQYSVEAANNKLYVENKIQKSKQKLCETHNDTGEDKEKIDYFDSCIKDSIESIMSSLNLNDKIDKEKSSLNVPTEENLINFDAEIGDNEPTENICACMSSLSLDSTKSYECLKTLNLCNNLECIVRKDLLSSNNENSQDALLNSCTDSKSTKEKKDSI